MAIARDATSNGVGSAITSLTVSHTSTGSDLIILSSILTLPGTDIVTGVTHDANAETRINTINNDGGANGSQRKYLYYRIAPGTGAKNVVTSTSESATILDANVTYTGAQQSAQPDANNTSFQTSGTARSVVVTTVADNCVVVCGFRRNAGDNGAAGAGTTQIQDDGADGGALYESDPLAVTPAGAKTINVTISVGATDSLACAASIVPAAAAVTTESNHMALLGVG